MISDIPLDSEYPDIHGPQFSAPDFYPAGLLDVCTWASRLRASGRRRAVGSWHDMGRLYCNHTSLGDLFWVSPSFFHQTWIPTFAERWHWSSCSSAARHPLCWGWSVVTFIFSCCYNARISQLGFFNQMDLSVNTGRIVCGCWKIHSALLSPPSLDSTGMGMPHQRQVKSDKFFDAFLPSCSGMVQLALGEPRSFGPWNCTEKREVEKRWLELRAKVTCKLQWEILVVSLIAEGFLRRWRDCVISKEPLARFVSRANKMSKSSQLDMDVHIVHCSILFYINAGLFAVVKNLVLSSLGLRLLECKACLWSCGTSCVWWQGCWELLC